MARRRRSGCSGEQRSVAAAELLAQLAQSLERQLRQDRFLGVEVEVERAFAQVSAAGDGSDRGPCNVLGKDRGAAYRISCLRRARSSSRRSAAATFTLLKDQEGH